MACSARVLLALAIVALVLVATSEAARELRGVMNGFAGCRQTGAWWLALAGWLACWAARHSCCCRSSILTVA